MAFSKEWENLYKLSHYQSKWPWSDVVSLTHRHLGRIEGKRILELGCGDGANIPFFVAAGAKYYGVEGSKYQSSILKDRYKDDDVTISNADFTEHIPFDIHFDMVLDRCSLVCNSSDGIKKAINIAYEKMPVGGVFVGVDWYSTNYDDFQNLLMHQEIIDEHTVIFNTGYFKDFGKIHFFDRQEIEILFDRFEILELTEKRNKSYIPKEKVIAMWNIVARKV